MKRAIPWNMPRRPDGSPVLQRTIDRLRNLMVPAAAVLLLLASLGSGPASATAVCRKDGGEQECVKRIQLKARYGPGEFASCATVPGPLPEDPYIFGTPFVTEEAARIFTQQSLYCGNSVGFCTAPYFVRDYDYLPATSADPEFLPETQCRHHNSDADGIVWASADRLLGVCLAEQEGATKMCVNRPITCPTGFNLGRIRTNPDKYGCVRQRCNSCKTFGGGAFGGGGGGAGSGPFGGSGHDSNSAGNPIAIPQLEKQQLETDAVLAADFPFSLSRIYNSTGYRVPIDTPANVRLTQLDGSWTFAFDHRLLISTSPVTGMTVAELVRSDHKIRYFFLQGGTFTGESDEPGTFTALLDGSGNTIGYRYRNANDVDEDYTLSGRLSRVTRGGLYSDFTYDSNGRLSTIRSTTGRQLTFLYSGSEERVAGVTLPNGDTVSYTYGGEYDEIVAVALPGSTTRLYEYDSNRAPPKLASITDENGTVYAQFTYHSGSDLAESTQHAGGVNRYVTTPVAATAVQVETPLGEVSTYYYQIIAGGLRDVLQQQNCPGCTQKTASKTYDVNGLLDIATDFRGTTTDYDYGARALETQRIEAANDTNTPSAKRTIQTDWHASFRKPIERRTRNSANSLEAKTQWTYNARGQVTARCEIDPNDSVAMAYTCSATTAPNAAAKVRRWTYTYCEAADVALPNSTCPILGLAKTINGPRSSTDAGMSGLEDLTTYAYFPSTDESGCGTAGGICHRMGDLASVTNALGQVSDMLAYDKNGRVVRQRDVNGTITDLTYNARGALTHRVVRALASGASSSDDATTIFAYDNVGQVTRITQPDAVYLDYVYDNAHRLTDVVDSLGNRIHYTLDNAGNRVKEETFDASYNPGVPGQGLKRSLARQYNALSRLVRELNAANTATRDSTSYDTSPLADGYDANGNGVQFKDGLNVQTQQTFDPLNRLIKTIQDYTGTDPETANATTDYTYDARSNLRTVKDPDTLTTTYTYGGLNDLTDLDSPDTGHTGYAYDLAGNRISQTDNRGVISSYTYDALSRLRAIGYPTTSLNVAFNYDESNATTGCASSYPIGRLTRMTDSSGTTTYCYDRRGNVIAKTQVTTGNTLALAYTYTKADRVATITYPSGGIATYTYDTVGRTSSLTWKVNAGATPTTIVSSISYYPFGPLNVLTFGNGRTLTKTYDNDYVIDTIASSISDGLKLDFGRDVMGNLTSASSTLGASPPERQYVYDNLYRLSGVNDSTGAMLEDYDYNKTGDRTLKQFAGQAAQVYAYLSGTHRLGSVAGVNRNYDANGNTTDRGDGVTLGYDQRNRLASAAVPGNPTTYDYSGRGERTLKVQANGGTTINNRYIYNESGQMLADREIVLGASKGGGTTEYLFIDAVPVAVSRASGLSYVEADHLGTPRLAANPATNAKEWDWNLLDSSFGEHTPITNVVGKSIDLRFPGQRQDHETGLAYNYLREYSPDIGRYSQSDPIGLRGGNATFSYAGSNAILRTDRMGLYYEPYNTFFRLIWPDQRCASLKNRLDALDKEIEKRYEEIDVDPNPLPHTGPGPNYATQMGHWRIINDLDSRRRKLQDDYDDHCNPPSCTPSPAPSKQDSGAAITATAVTFIILGGLLELL
jgi:RHS repeat-associated protein